MKQPYPFLFALALFAVLSFKWENLLVAGLVTVVLSLAFAAKTMAAKAAKKGL